MGRGNRRTDGRTDRQAGEQTDRRAGQISNGQTSGWTDGQTDQRNQTEQAGRREKRLGSPPPSAEVVNRRSTEGSEVKHESREGCLAFQHVMRVILVCCGIWEVTGEGVKEKEIIDFGYHLVTSSD